MLTALALQFMDWDTGEGPASIEELADFCGTSRSTVQRALRWGAKEHLVTRTSRGHRIFGGEAAVSRWQLW